jgi:hypothetical protein
MVAPEFWYSSARQGGFSSLQLPAPGHCGDGIVIYSDGSAIRCSSPGVSTDGSLDVQHVSSGGPFGEPFFSYTTSMVKASGPPLLIGTDDFTLEGWFKIHPEDYGFELFPMLDTSNDDIDYTGFALYTGYNGVSGPFASFHEYPFANDESLVRTLEPFSVASWHHLAVARQYNELRAWGNGQRIATLVTGSPASQPVNYDSQTIISQRNNIGQTRFTPGFARYWGETIPVPSAPFV